MKNFGETKHCIKCKHGRFAGEIDCGILKYVPRELKDCVIIEEYMDVTCRNCGYVYQEKCADNKNKE